MITRKFNSLRCASHAPQAFMLLLLCSFVFFNDTAWTMESRPVRVLSVDSGLRLTVAGEVGGLPISVPVQIAGISLIGPPELAQQKLRELCPVGTQVTLRVLPEEQVSSDVPNAYPSGSEIIKTAAGGVIFAEVERQFPASVDPAAPPVPANARGPVRGLMQVEMIRAGWAIPAAENNQSVRRSQWFAQAEHALREAKMKKMGAYSLPEFAHLAENARQLGPGRPPQGQPRVEPPINQPPANQLPPAQSTQTNEETGKGF
jgi:hypothetical protein